MRGKRFFKAGVAMLMTLVVVAGLVINPVSLLKSDASASALDKVFFNAALETDNSFRSDVVYENLGGNNLTLSTPADAFITPEGYLQINYKSSATAANDGSYTVWGEGGDYFGGDQKFVRFVLKATEEDYASQFSVSFYFEGSSVATYSFATWLSDSGYSKTQIDAAVGSFQTFDLKVPSTDNYKGMKLKFNQGSSSGTLYIDSITFGESTIFDSFDYASRNNAYTDVNGNRPMYRPSTSINGSLAGHNYASNMMWSASTMMANIVDNANSGGRALQIDYNTNTDSYAMLSSSSTVSGEPLLALTVKGDSNANGSMSVKLMNGNTVVDTLSISDFATTPAGSVVASIGSGYQTIYAEIDPSINFNVVRFEFDGENVTGKVFVKDVYFPRYSYTVEHYFDDAIDSSKTETYSGLKYGDSIDGGYTDYSDTIYSISDVVYSNRSKTITGDADSIKVYYVSEVDYSINYYYDGIKDDSKTETGSDKLGAVKSWSDKPVAGYVFDHASVASIVLGTGTNVIDVYYVKGTYGYTINYYYDDVKDDTKTVIGTELFGEEVSYTDKNIEGYKFVSASADKITISENAANNVINVYYAKDSFGYTVEYYYDGVKDDTKTESGTVLYVTEIGYTDKNITGYKFDGATADKITIGTDVSKNIIKVYYVKDSFGYTIEYYYDGVIDNSKTETGTALYQSTVGFEHKNITGYEFVSASPEKLTISEIEDSNVIKVYYAKDSFLFTINYYYDSVKDDSKTVTGSAAYNSEVGYDDKNITGYKFDSATAEKITISEDVSKNVIDVYYVKDSFGYTINYYYDGVKDDSKTVTGTALYQSVVGYADKNITGYKFDSASADSITISEVASNNVIDVYYVKDGFPYTINYYYDGVKDDSKTESGTALYQSVIGYTDKNITGYKFDSASSDEIIIGVDANDNVIDVYYVKDSFPYTINYYYDGVKDDSKTESGTALYQSVVGYADKNITGYKFDSASAEEITIDVDADNNVINVYYVKDSFPYTINYYYDGVKDDSKTVTGTAEYQSVVGYTDKNITGYKFDSATVDSITISADAVANVIDVYYVKDSFGYTINYYYDSVKDDTKTVTGTAEYQSVVGYTDKVIEGFKFVSATADSITISEIAENNVINVYYAKDTFGYTINYYYDGIKDDSKTDIGTALYQSKVGYTDKNITGYKFDSATADEITITNDAALNVIDVYYVKDSFGYTIEYYYDGVIDDTKTVAGTALYQSTVGYEDKNITGYKFVSASPEELTVSEIEASNVIRVYYAKDSFPYTINYYYDGVKDDTKTVNGTAVYQQTVGYEDKNITGYKFDSASVEEITISADAVANVIDVYYVKDSFGYTINYYYDGVKDDTKTVTGTAVYQSEVGYTDKNITGYKFDSVSAETITISEIASTNVINVYYVKDSFGYTINYYYDGVKDDSKTESGTALYQSVIGYADKNITGYKFDSVSAETIVISEVAENNVIDVYYVKDSFGYVIEYYYDGVIDDSKTVTGEALYKSEVGYEDKNIAGYKFDTATAETIIISEQEENNVIKVYYVKDSFDYVINYYYDGVIDETLTEEGTAVYLSDITYTDNIKEGYKLDKVDPESGTINISYDVEKNVINVYYVKYSVEYTIEYYYDNVIDSSLTVKGSGLYGDTVTYEPQLKDGYKFVKVSAEKITLGDEENIIKVYYEKIPAPVTPPATGDDMSVARPIVTMMLCLLVLGATCVVSVKRRRG